MLVLRLSYVPNLPQLRTCVGLKASRHTVVTFITLTIHPFIRIIYVQLPTLLVQLSLTPHCEAKKRDHVCIFLRQASTV